ncbi:outer membrane biosynthesis protein TonB [Bradyrhizobium sp. USDA 4501]
MKFRPNADLMASVFVHLMLLALIFLYSEVHQFDPVAADTVPVEIVTPQEVAKSEVETKPEPAPSPSPTPELQLPSLDKPVDSAKPEPSAQAPAPQQNAQQQPPQKQATPPAPKPSPAPQRAAAEPLPTPAQQTPPMPQPTAQQQAAASPPAYAQPEPDLSVKYNVMLGLPPDISVKPPASAPSGLGPGKDNFDAAATEQADVGSSVVAEFRRHLKTCLKLPPTLSAGDDVKIKLRVFMKPDGKLAASPLLIEATASEKGPLLLKSATDALQACQPYAMLPRDRYGEWKVLDLDFSPRDFAS